MPISEDELDHKGSSQGHQGYHSHQSMQIHSHQPVTGMSKAEQRRSNKPIMEKRRRARINHCLNELKSLILDAMKKDPARHSKLEKADILEMTVKHLQNVQRQQLAVAVATDPNVLHKFRTGFNECAGEVSRYIGRIEGVDPAVRTRLLAHLASCVSGLHQLTPFSFGAMAAVSSTPPGTQVPFPPPPTPPNGQTLSATSSATVPLPAEEGSGVLPCGTPCSSASIPASIHIPQFHSGDVNNNQSQQQSPAARLMAGLQLIPSRLPTGELALLVPGSGRLSDGMDGGMSFSSSVSPGISASFSTSSSSLLNTSGPSPSASGSPHGHHSAFTAVTRSSSSPPSPPPPLQMPVGPSSPASSTSSSCASTSCDSTTFSKHPTSVEKHQHIQQPHHNAAEDHKFSFGFHCPPLQQSSFSSEVKTFPFPPLSLSNPGINSAPITSSFMEAGESIPIMPPLKVDTRESKHEVMQPKVLNLEKDVTSTQDDPCIHFKHRVSGPISASQSLSPCTECPITPVLSASSKIVLNEGKLSCPPIPSIVTPLNPYFSSAVVSSSTRDPLDFSVKKERAFGEDLTNDRVPRLSLGYGIKRLAEDNECSNAEDDEIPRPTKIARLDVKLEPSLGSREGLKDSVITEGKVTIDVMARPSSSSAISSSAGTSTEESSSLDMWRPW